MLKKNYKKVMVVLFLGLFLFSGLMFFSTNAERNLCNIDYHATC